MSAARFGLPSALKSLSLPVIIALGCFVLGSIAMMTEMVLYSQNTLAHNRNWIVAKRMTILVTTGGDEYLLQNTSLAHNHLNLGRSFGFQKVSSRRSFYPSTIRVHFWLEQNTYLTVFFGESPDRYFGVRLSNSSRYPSAVIEGRPSGEILASTPLSWVVTPEKKSELILEIDQGLKIELDGKKIFDGPIPSEIPKNTVEIQANGRKTQDRRERIEGKVGFWGGFRPAYIEDVEIREKNGEVFLENFRNSRYRWQIALEIAFLLVFICQGCTDLAIARKKRITKMQSQKSFYTWVTVYFTCTAIAAAFFAFDWFFWSTARLEELSASGKFTRNFVAQFEDSRKWFFGLLPMLAGDVPTFSIRQLDSREIERQGYSMGRLYQGPLLCSEPENIHVGTCTYIGGANLNQTISPKRKGIRILYSGSSQTFGVGATSLNGSIFARVHFYLRKRIPKQVPLQSLNIAVSADTVDLQFERSKDLFLRFHPDLAVFNWSNNGTEEALVKGLTEFLELCKSEKIAALLILEPNSEEPGTRIVLRHQLVMEIAKKFSVPYFDLHRIVNSPEKFQSGYLWWDVVHFTDWGQEIAAELLAPQVEELLPI